MFKLAKFNSKIFNSKIVYFSFKSDLFKFLLVICLLVLPLANLKTLAQSNKLPYGYIDRISLEKVCNQYQIRVEGWAKNPETLGSPIAVQLYLAGKLAQAQIANGQRKDVGQGVFAFQVPISFEQYQSLSKNYQLVKVYALDPEGVDNPSLPFSSNNPLVTRDLGCSSSTVSSTKETLKWQGRTARFNWRTRKYDNTLAEDEILGQWQDRECSMVFDPNSVTAGFILERNCRDAIRLMKSQGGKNLHAFRLRYFIYPDTNGDKSYFDAYKVDRKFAGVRLRQVFYIYQQANNSWSNWFFYTPDGKKIDCNKGCTNVDGYWFADGLSS